VSSAKMGVEKAKRLSESNRFINNSLPVFIWYKFGNFLVCQSSQIECKLIQYA